MALRRTTRSDLGSAGWDHSSRSNQACHEDPDRASLVEHIQLRDHTPIPGKQPLLPPDQLAARRCCAISWRSSSSSASRSRLFIICSSRESGGNNDKFHAVDASDNSLRYSSKLSPPFQYGWATWIRRCDILPVSP